MKLTMIGGWLVLVCGVVGLATGCGAECAEGTTEVDGACVATAQGCGTGTVRRNGECVVANGCTDGHTFDLDSGRCVPNDVLCGEGTVFDEGVQACVPDSEVTCTEGLVVDPQTGQCLLSEDVCQGGTRFDRDSGHCVAVTCADGEVLVAGQCVDEAEHQASQADLLESENNDPDLGGSAEALELKGVGEPGFVFAGTIAEPADFDQDGEADQDVDAYAFEASEGAWLEVSVRSTGPLEPAFKVEGPDGFQRWSRFGRQVDATRTVVIPTDGTYNITVLPTQALQSGGEVAALGADDWSYVGSITQVSFPDGDAVDFAGDGARMSGHLLGLRDNVFAISGTETDGLIRLTPESLSEDVQAVAQVWDGDDTLISSQVVVPGHALWLRTSDASDVRVVVDWITVEGALLDFTFDAHRGGKGKQVSLAPGDSISLSAEARAFDSIIASILLVDPFSAPGPEGVDVQIEDASGAEIGSSERAHPGRIVHATSLVDGTHKVTFTNRSSRGFEAVFLAKLNPPIALGALSGDTNVVTDARDVSVEVPLSVKFSVAANQYVEVAHDNDQSKSANLSLIDDAGHLHWEETLLAQSEFDASRVAPLWRSDSAAEYLLVLEPDSAVTGQTIAFRSVSASNTGTVGVDQAASDQWHESLEPGFSGFHEIRFDDPMNVIFEVLDGSTRSLRCALYDETLTELASKFRHGGRCDFGDLIDAPGDYLLRVTATGSGLSGYDLDVSGFASSEHLGAVGPSSATSSSVLSSFYEGNVYSMTFSVEADQLIQITHDNATGGHVGVLLKDGGGNLVASASPVYPVGGQPFGGQPIGGQQERHEVQWYSAAGGSFELDIYAADYITDAMITVRSLDVP